jgi:hypothetical protein
VIEKKFSSILYGLGKGLNWNGLSSPQVFNAVPSPFFLSACELARRFEA